MSVAAQLGLQAGLESDLLREADARWATWSTAEPTLDGVGSLGALPGWLRMVESMQSDQVLHTLVRLGANGSGATKTTTAVVAWALLPGACTVARRLQALTPQIDELVASQLWIEIKTFPWVRLQKVAANVLANTRAGVLRECGASRRPRGLDRTWASTVVVDVGGPVWWGDQLHDPAEPDAAAQLGSLLTSAQQLGVLDDRDRLILDRLVAHADTAGSVRARRGQGGLLGDRLVALVAGDVGVSPTTVRRRTRVAVAAVAAACRAGQIEAA